ncbi:thiamine ABC transporter substrate binding subunit [Pararhodobacter zhoushanensis]|uniref:Thiamine-binding periplasmic protein n=2 Tax=Pararhodobacter zhoushanensis TaxID=2479545 RepID=A0ABT3GTK8_9RHOB|nr:thiamine ABC transporter substrate binding subunit [Pararhodobacter zhoushanensis]MCW1930863.1 thiamine ABC transporter substrate binding subunit [Pararhodobacter zhoushanensis]
MANAQTPQLRVLTYDSFIADWGPGPQIEAAFEATCGCDLVFEAAGDAAAMLARLMLEGARSDTDVVLGLDTNLTAAAAEAGLIAPHGLSPQLDLPVAWDDPLFVPFDWSWFAFVYDTTRVATPPRSFADLIDSDLSVVIQDPRSSTPGLGLLMWVKALYGDQAGAIWQGLAPRILTVTPGWSEAYGLFLEGEADMVLSYTTSPAYHIIAEGDDTKAAALFDEGHYMQVEVGGVVAGTDQPELAAQFLDFMTSDAAQALIPETNWMYPAVMPEGGLAEGFAALPRPEVSILLPADAAQALRDPALAEWRDALAQ